MATKLFFRLVCIAQILSVIRSEYEIHTEEDHHDAFDLSKDYIKELELQNEEHSENITTAGVSLLVENILKRTNCSNQNGMTENSCNECLDPVDLFNIVGADVAYGLDEDQYEKVSLVILSILSTHYATCVTSNTYDQHYVTLTGGNQNVDKLAEDDFESIVQNVSRIYNADIYYKCFTAEDEFDHLVANHTVGAETSEVQELSALVIYNLFRGYCIGEPTAVDPESFTDELFEMYADDDVITEEGFELMLEALEIGEITEDHGDEDAGEDDGHNHRKRRETDDDDHDHDDDDHDHDHDHDHGDHDEDEHHYCYSGENLLDIFGIDHETGLHRDDLQRICPALLQQVLSKSCKEVHEEHPTEEPEEDKGKKWAIAISSVIIISLSSLMGVFIFPCIGRTSYVYVIQTLIALAMATLSGDAILHLLPQAFGLHAHGADAHDDHEDEGDHGPLSEELEYIWKGLVTMGAIYAFFLVERIMGMVVMERRESAHHHHHHGEFPLKNSNNVSKVGPKDEDELPVISNKEQESLCKRFSSVALMILIGDSVHNFADGLAIGAAFALSIGAGVSTSVAVLCHELPHEFGDFAVLLNSGLKFKEALILNFLSALAALAGVCVGLPIGENTETRQWIFAVVAGMFLYVALGNMMPELMNPGVQSGKWWVFLLQNIGFIVGTGILLVIALYEDEIAIDV